MGFRCPACREDFGRDKDAWRQHLRSSHEGAAELAVNAVLRLAEDLPIEHQPDEAKR
jgi:hypothetical protein